MTGLQQLEEVAARHAGQCSPLCPECLASDLLAVRDAQRDRDAKVVESFAAMCESRQAKSELLRAAKRIRGTK